MSIRLRINLLLFVFGGIACVIVAGFSYYESKNHIFADALEKAQLISSFAMASRDYTVETIRPVALKLIGEEVFHPEIMAGLHVARAISDIFSEKMNQYSFKQASLDPIFPGNQADDNEKAIIRYFSENRDVSQKKGIIQRAESRMFYVASPVVVQPGCLQCHYSRETAPAGVAEKYPGPGGYGWNVDQVIGTFIVYVPIQNALENLQSATLQKFTAGVVAILLLLISIGIFMKAFVTNPIVHLTALTDEMRTGRELGVHVEADTDTYGDVYFDKSASPTDRGTVEEARADEPAVKKAVKGDEIKRLAESFTTMKGELRKNIRNLMEITAAKERLEGELNVARDIQLGLLPKVFPPFPEYQEKFDLFAMLMPAREVGGDLFDYFFIDDETLCFTLGDVSDKGVPAALFMTITLTLIKNTAKICDSPAEVMRRVNEALSTDNPRSMFVTLIIGFFNITTGEVRYANAGHNLPVLVKADGKAAYQQGLSGPVAGAVAGVDYTELRLRLEPGDALFLYTDGVTEAMDMDNNLFSDQRLEAEMNQFGNGHVEQVIPEMMKKIQSHAGPAPQSDDIAMLMLRYKGLP